MQLLSYIIWSPNPNIFVIPGLDHPVRWYGLLFALGFIFSQQIMVWIFRKEGKPEKHVEKLTVYMVLATIIGARLGHCLFYDPARYLANPLEILKVWEGGLASHGGALGILVALYLFSKKFPYSYLWILDRIVIVVALTGALIRTGNFFNSEIEGKETYSNFGVVYAGYTEEYLKTDGDIESIDFEPNASEGSSPGRVPLAIKMTYKPGVQFDLQKQQLIEGNLAFNLSRLPDVIEHIDFGEGALNYRTYQANGQTVVELYATGIVRHAAQMYEAIYCLILMGLLFLFWHKKRATLPSGFNFALFMIILWSARFIDEFFKMNQVAFEDSMTLNMGQWLSIPLALFGMGLMFWLFTKKDQPRMQH